MELVLIRDITKTKKMDEVLQVPTYPYKATQRSAINDSLNTNFALTAQWTPTIMGFSFAYGDGAVHPTVLRARLLKPPYVRKSEANRFSYPCKSIVSIICLADDYRALEILLHPREK